MPHFASLPDGEATGCSYVSLGRKKMNEEEEETRSLIYVLIVLNTKAIVSAVVDVLDDEK